MSAIKEKHYGNAEIIRKNIFEMYKEMVDAISDAHFKPIQDEIQAQTGKNVDLKTAVDVFKHSLYEGIEHKLTSSWSDLEVDKSLASLSLSKELATDDSQKWRPTNADPRKRVLPAVVTVKNRMKALLERQLQYQSKIIEQLVMEVEQERGRLNLQEEQTKHIVEQIERNREKDAKVTEQIDSIYSAWWTPKSDE